MRIIRVVLLMLVFCAGNIAGNSWSGENRGDSFDIILIIDTAYSLRALNADKRPLELFADNLKSGSRLGIVTFGERAEVVYSLEPPAKEDADIKNGIEKIRFRERYGDMKAGLEAALLEFNKNSRPGASKIAVLIGDGKSSSSLTIRGALSDLSKTLLDYANNKISVYPVVYGDGYLPIMRNIADTTKGRYFIAPNPGALSEVLLTLAEKTQTTLLVTIPKKETPATEAGNKGRRPEYNWPLIFTLLSLALTLSFIVLWILRGADRRLKPTSASISSPGFYNDFGLLLSKINETGADPERLRLDLESCAAKMWNQEKEARTKYHGLINGVLLWLDHFEQAAKENKTGKADEWLFRKARRILEDEGIEEIAVKRGEMFDGRRHKQGGSRPDGLPKDAILELLRKGYYIKGRGNQEDVVFRPAEVVCSSGPRS